MHTLTTTIIGSGRVGKALFRAAKHAGAPARLLGRVGLEAGQVEQLRVEQGAILVCTTCDGVEAVHAAVPAGRRSDLVYASNGMHLRFFAQNDIDAEDVTQSLLYLNAQDDESLQDGQFSAVTGRHSSHIKLFLEACGIQCAHLETGAFTARMLLKLIWSSVLWLVCHAHGGVTVGKACELHHNDIQQLVFELYPVAQLYALEAVPAYMQHYLSEPVAVQEVLEGVLEYSKAVASAVPSVDMARREFEWRNGFLLWRQPTPHHVALLRRAGFGAQVDSIASAEGWS